MNTRLLWLCLVLGSSSAPLVAAETKEGENSVPSDRLTEVQKLKSDSLKAATSIVISPDGKFAYSAAFGSSEITTFTRDTETGQLEPLSAFTRPSLNAVVSLRLSTDGEYAVASAFRSAAITLYKRNAKTGALQQLDIAKQGENGNDGLSRVIDATFSKEGKFIYTAAPGGVAVFAITDDKLVFKQLQTAEDKLKGVRDVCLSPDGNVLYAAGAESNNVVVFSADAGSGLLEVRQILTDGTDGDSLKGVFRIACSPKGDYIYVNSGRFGGDQAVSVFAQADGKLKLVEEHVDSKGDFKNFQGGNGIAVSPDGTKVYALAAESDRIAAFTRDPATGKLTFGGTQVAGDFASPGCAGLCFSPDGRFLYVADENGNAVLAYKVP